MGACTLTVCLYWGLQVLKLYDGSITAPIVRMLKEAAAEKKATGL